MLAEFSSREVRRSFDVHAELEALKEAREAAAKEKG